MDKSELRAFALARRDGTSPQWRARQSNRLASHVDALLLAPGRAVSGFFPIRSEIDLRPLMTALHQRDVPLCLPAVLDRETIVFRRFTPGMPLVDTGFGTSGPGRQAEEVDPETMLVPLAAFDDLGNRIGYGAGHYDRAIARLSGMGKRPQLIGCAFACQRVERIPAEQHDVPLDSVLTEDGLRGFAR
ncbi:MAG: 5-formyltetrahydrofolate cyclo-ligase [Pseudomonadota bacterium]